MVQLVSCPVEKHDIHALLNSFCIYFFSFKLAGYFSMFSYSCMEIECCYYLDVGVYYDFKSTGCKTIAIFNENFFMWGSYFFLIL